MMFEAGKLYENTNEWHPLFLGEVIMCVAICVDDNPYKHRFLSRAGFIHLIEGPNSSSWSSGFKVVA
jgi:hypothetical protein